MHPIYFKSDTRKRRPDGSVLEDGEAVHFDLAFRDSATATTRYLTDVAKGFALDSVVRRQIDAQHAAHDAKFAFLGDAAPAFDRDRAALLARAKFGNQTGDTVAVSASDRASALASSRYADNAKRIEMPEGTASASAPTHDAQQAKPAAINALRHARYQG